MAGDNTRDAKVSRVEQTVTETVGEHRRKWGVREARKGNCVAFAPSFRRAHRVIATSRELSPDTAAKHDPQAGMAYFQSPFLSFPSSIPAYLNSGACLPAASFGYIYSSFYDNEFHHDS